MSTTTPDLGASTSLRVQLVAATQFFPPADVPWTASGTGGQDLAEFAGRACYQSWSKPNPATATNRGYVNHIIEVGHGSVLEHASVSFYLTGVSRSLTHELVRHRHFSFSQLSQRFVNSAGQEFVIPDVIAQDDELLAIFDHAAGTADRAYSRLVERLDAKLSDSDLPATARRKAARQAARAVLPNATETRIVVTGNYRAMRHFLAVRGDEAADVEIRALAVELRNYLVHVAPSVFGDFEVVRGRDGLPALVSPHANPAP